jgi:hypothetical protein
MPRACPVVIHESSYSERRVEDKDATGLSGGASRLVALFGEK